MNEKSIHFRSYFNDVVDLKIKKLTFIIYPKSKFGFFCHTYEIIFKHLSTKSDIRIDIFKVTTKIKEIF